ncbi:LssY C-terminal domain-containing protein [Arthrobacter dokdonensis]|uniref:LssY C-terminal domain-containing protein n=1 Tax=Arthrobacter dokdonellae TaxID=2211210 RepID=UPI001D131AB7|nr:LssY C-terminal domain-containing protein [Arthrobacter dokdonellae]
MESTALLWLQRGFLFIVTVVAGWVIYELIVLEIHNRARQPWLFLVIWVVAAYVLLPRLNRVLSRLYVPDYFIGRTRTADGLLGDPVNLAVIGTMAELRSLMLAAGWCEPDPVTLRSSWRIIEASLLRRSYPSAPVSALFVFQRKQTMAFEREVDGSPAQRHHVRFWVCPDGWKLPGGFDVDLIGAATFDRRVGLSLFTFQVTHKIAENTDRERDLVVADLQVSGATVHTIRHFSTGYHSRNGGGDAIETDGDLPVLFVGRTGSERVQPVDAPPSPA